MEDQIKRFLTEAPKTNRELRVALGLSPRSYDAKLDRTLQQLRKKGVIRVHNGRWVTANVKTCPTCGGKGLV